MIFRNLVFYIEIIKFNLKILNENELGVEGRFIGYGREIIVREGLLKIYFLGIDILVVIFVI